jgi:hypothetical protein
MKFRQSFNLVIGSAIIGVVTVSSNAYAQSAFAGFYGQVSTGYESNQLGSVNGNYREKPNVNSDTDVSASSQNFGDAPLVLGVGYYWQASEKWLIGLGADYSALTQSSSTFPINIANTVGNSAIPANTVDVQNGTSMQLSNRFNLFLTPAYAIDKDKLVYVKAGYSQVTAQYNRNSSVTKTANGVSTTTPATGGNQSSNQGGYLIGLGYKQIITGGLYGFAEGNYMSYSAPSYTFNAKGKAINVAHDITSTGVRTGTMNFSSLNTYQLLVGLGYAF